MPASFLSGAVEVNNVDVDATNGNMLLCGRSGAADFSVRCVPITLACREERRLSLPQDDSLIKIDTSSCKTTLRSDLFSFNRFLASDPFNMIEGAGWIFEGGFCFDRWHDFRKPRAFE